MCKCQRNKRWSVHKGRQNEKLSPLVTLQCYSNRDTRDSIGQCLDGQRPKSAVRSVGFVERIVFLFQAQSKFFEHHIWHLTEFGFRRNCGPRAAYDGAQHRRTLQYYNIKHESRYYCVTDDDDKYKIHGLSVDTTTNGRLTY